MKKIRPHLKRIALLLIFLMTLQSCSVYYSKTASVDEALLSDNKVKVITTTNDIYKFKKLQTENDQIYGLLKQRSTKGENLLDQGLLEDYDGKYGKLLLSQDAIQAIHLKNKGASTAVTVAIPVVIVGVLVGIGVHSANNISIDLEF
jgi:hypothetical protein